MTEIDLNRIASDIHLNTISLNVVNMSEEHPEYDFGWFTLDQSVLDGNDLLM